MTNHLPECQLATGVYDDRADCICDELRACEQRVRYTDWATDNAYWTGQTEGYAAALEASIAAVCEAIGEEWQGKIVPKCEYDCCGCNSYNGIVDDAVTAIKALGGER